MTVAERISRLSSLSSRLPPEKNRSRGFPFLLLDLPVSEYSSLGGASAAILPRCSRFFFERLEFDTCSLNPNLDFESSELGLVGMDFLSNSEADSDFWNVSRILLIGFFECFTSNSDGELGVATKEENFW